MLDIKMKLHSLFTSVLLITYTLILTENACQASEESQFVQANIQNEVHKENIGKIVFTQLSKPINDYQQSDLISTLNLNSSKNLYFTVFLNQPLTKSLQELAPDLSVEEVNTSGNYHFSFYVDKELIYTENLNFGAGLASQKLNDLTLKKPFFSEQNEDSWGRFLWMRFMHFGGEQALTEGVRKLRIEIRSYVKTADIKVGKIIATGQITINVVKPTATEKQIAIQSIQKGSGWHVSSESYDKDKIRALNKKIAQEDFKKISSIVIIKNGELLIEEYFNGKLRGSLHDTRSVGKSFASTMLGIAINEGYITSEEQTLSDFYDLKKFDNQSVSKANVSLRDLLTMTSGFEGDDSDQYSLGNEENMYPTDD